MENSADVHVVVEQASSMHYVDLGVLGILLISGIVAFIRGFVREIFSLAAWIGAALVSSWLYPHVTPWVHHYIKNEMAANAAAALGLFCLLLVIFIPIGSLIAGMIKGQALTAIDRSLGFVFGLVRGVLVVSLIYLVTIWIWPDQSKLPDWLANAKTQPLMSRSANALKDLFPEEERNKLEAELRKKREIADDASDAANALEKMSAPQPGVPAQNGQKANPNYDQTDREQLNKLIDEKAHP